MAHRSLSQLFNEARQYLDTDDLNFPDALLDQLLRKVWYQAVTMEREWRFFQRAGTVDVPAGQSLVPFTFAGLPASAIPGTRLLTVLWNDTPLVWVELSYGLRGFAGAVGSPCQYSEQNEGVQRNVVLFPEPSIDGVLNVEFFAEPVYPVVNPGDFAVTFADLPDEFDDALKEGLLAEMYMREEDPDLYDGHRQMFLEQMGSIRNRWRESLYTPMVVAGKARHPGRDPGGYYLGGYVKWPVAPG